MFSFIPFGKTNHAGTAYKTAFFYNDFSLGIHDIALGKVI